MITGYYDVGLLSLAGSQDTHLIGLSICVRRNHYQTPRSSRTTTLRINVKTKIRDRQVDRQTDRQALDQ